MSRVSVLMSVYKAEKAEYLEKALESILGQTRRPDEIVLVEDGPIGDELAHVIARVAERVSVGTDGRDVTEFKIVKLSENQKLGRALASGFAACTGDLIARMDTDDIAVPNRLELQCAYMAEHGSVAAVGGDIAEFIDEGKILRVKHMPTSSEALYAYGKLRNPLNHMTVMFRRADIAEVGGYRHFPGLEDYDLWSRLLAAGKQIGNIPEVLVEARIDRDFAGRRGGWKYFLNYASLRWEQYRLGYTSFWEYMKGLACSAVMTIQPGWLRELSYRWLRKSKKK